MAGEHLISTIADLFASEELSTEFLYTLADRDGSLLSHPVFQSHKTGAVGSNVVKVPIIGVGADLMANATPGTQIGYTQFTDSSVDVTVAFKALNRAFGDLAHYVTKGRLGVQLLAQDLSIAYQQTLISMFAVAGAGFTTNTVGTSGSDLTWAIIKEAKGKLQLAKATGPMIAVLHPQQWVDLESDASNLTIMEASAGHAGALNSTLDNYKGRFAGIDFFTSSHVPTANSAADRAGFLAAPGSFAWADAMMEAIPEAANLGRARLERERHAGKLQTDYVESAVLGVSIGVDAAGCAIVTDA